MQHSRIIHASTCRTKGNRSIIWSELEKEETNLWFKPWAQILWRWRYFRVLFFHFLSFLSKPQNHTCPMERCGCACLGRGTFWGVRRPSCSRGAKEGTASLSWCGSALRARPHIAGGWGPLPGTPHMATGPLPALRYSLTAPLLVNSPSTGFCGSPPWLAQAMRCPFYFRADAASWHPFASGQCLKALFTQSLAFAEPGGTGDKGEKPACSSSPGGSHAPVGWVRAQKFPECRAAPRRPQLLLPGAAVRAQSPAASPTMARKTSPEAEGRVYLAQTPRWEHPTVHIPSWGEQTAGAPKCQHHSGVFGARSHREQPCSSTPAKDLNNCPVVMGILLCHQQNAGSIQNAAFLFFSFFNVYVCIF